jgi:hypothetical protein
MMHPKAIENILDYSKRRIASFQKLKDTGLIEIRCWPSQDQYKVECWCGNLQNFAIAAEDLAVWETIALSRERENLETMEQVLTNLNSALYETFRLHQGYANIVIYHSGYNGRYGFQFSPSLVHGIKPFWSGR